MNAPAQTVWGHVNFGTFAALGADGMLAEADMLVERDPVGFTDVVLTHWEQFAGRPETASALLRAAQVHRPDVAEVHDLLLGAPPVLAVIADDLVDVVQQRASISSGLDADIAVETWTRLALGEWCDNLGVSGRLQTMANRVAGGRAEASGHLVRAIGAALHRWGYPSLAVVLSALVTVDGCETDAALELAMHELALMCAATNLGTAATHLKNALDRFGVALSEGPRADAMAFRVPLSALAHFVDGHTVTAEDVTDSRRAVAAYLTGYRGLRRHWRQGRADTSSAWSDLVSLLHAASAADQPDWANPVAVIDAAASLMIAETTLTLVARGEDGRGVAALVEPHIVGAYRAANPTVARLDGWLALRSAPPDGRDSLADAIRTLRHQVLAEAAATPPKRDDPVSVGTEDPALQFRTYLADQRLLNRTEEVVALQVIADINRIAPTDAAAVAPSLAAVVAQLVRFTSFYLNLRQTGARKPDWLGRSSDFSYESALSDELYRWMSASLLGVSIEGRNVAGGDTDLHIVLPDASFVVEVKRELADRTDEWLAQHYGDQAAQYASTSEPIVFLAVLDYAPRRTRIDLPGAIWTVQHQHDGASRPYAVTGFRIQANVEPPSASSR